MNKLAVVTGGAGNIGQAIVERLAKDNYRIVILDMNQEAGSKVVGEFAKRDIDLDFHCANLSEEAAVKTTFDAVIAKQRAHRSFGQRRRRQFFPPQV